MKKSSVAAFSILLLPFVTHAQGLQEFLINTIYFLNDTVINFLLAIAFLFFVFNVIRFFVYGSANEQGREKAKAQAIYGVAAIVLILIFWGLVNLIANGIGLEGEYQPQSDYRQEGPGGGWGSEDWDSDGWDPEGWD